MKTTLTLLLGLILPAIAAIPPVGTVADDIVFSAATEFSGGRFGNLNDTMLSEHSGKVLLLAYATPW